MPYTHTHIYWNTTLNNLVLGHLLTLNKLLMKFNPKQIGFGHLLTLTKPLRVESKYLKETGTGNLLALQQNYVLVTSL